MVFAKLDCKPRWRERLSELAILALVVHGRRDPFFPVGNGEALVREIPAQVLQQAQRLGGHGQAAPAVAGPVELGVNHEILHHGQLIVYANALGRAFPASWAAFGL
jgi:hypothetical protein